MMILPIKEFQMMLHTRLLSLQKNGRSKRSQSYLVKTNSINIIIMNVPTNYWPMHKEVWWEEHGKLNYNQRIAVLDNPHSPLGKRLAEKVHQIVMGEMPVNKKKN